MERRTHRASGTPGWRSSAAPPTWPTSRRPVRSPRPCGRTWLRPPRPAGPDPRPLAVLLTCRVPRTPQRPPLGNPLDRLPGELSDPVVVSVVVQHGRAIRLGRGGDDQVRQREMTVLAAGGEHPMDLQSPLHRGGVRVDPAVPAQGGPQNLILLRVRG